MASMLKKRTAIIEEAYKQRGAVAMKITQVAICEWFESSRRAHNQMKLRHLVRSEEEAIL